ncbi:MAG: aminoglycoside phosphotransferase (APT) family kinase protein [Myxococcota bacterium]|jgi:aminoglycoside phosphotransferase (APT) family kinase protein
MSSDTANGQGAAAAEPVKGIKVDSVTQWLDANIEGLKPPFTFSLIVGGHSNLTYMVSDTASRRIVLRRPPTGAVLATAHDMAREHRIVSAVGKSAVPVPDTLGLCEDIEVNDAPFYVMDYVDGTVLNDAEATEALLGVEERKALSEHTVEVLAALHAVNPDDIGLGDLAKREDYIPRQLKRWQGQWEKSKTRELPQMDEVFAGLSHGIPEQHGSGIVHGDYRLGNMLVNGQGRILAVLDWELCTLGDTLADVGYLMNNWFQPEESSPDKAAAFGPTSVGGFSTREEFVARYCERTGRDLSAINYYRAFQYWRLAAIVEGVLSRYLKGVMANEANTDLFRAQIDSLANSALELVNDRD